MLNKKTKKNLLKLIHEGAKKALPILIYLSGFCIVAENTRRVAAKLNICNNTINCTMKELPSIMLQLLIKCMTKS